MKKIYERSFKERAIKLSFERGRRQIAGIEREMGITASLLYRWRKVSANCDPKSSYVKRGTKLTDDQILIAELEKKIKDSELELEILQGSSIYAAQGKTRIIEFIENNKHKYSIKKMCSVLRLPLSTYYNRKNRKTSVTESRVVLLKEEIRSIYFEFKREYGCVKITKELQKRGFKIHNTSVKFYMKMLGLRRKKVRKYKATTDSCHNFFVSSNILNGEFNVNEPSKVWVSDITYIQTRTGFLYLTIIMDLFDRKIIGWNLSDGLSTKKTSLAAWLMALKNREIGTGLIFHSDRGVQYANKIFTSQLDSHGCVRRSMSRKENHTDNAVCESFFKLFKTELISGNKLLMPKQMKAVIFEYIENWYNKMRRHSYLGNISIEEFNKINLKSQSGAV